MALLHSFEFRAGHRGLHGRRDDGSRLRDRLLGNRAQPLGQSVRGRASRRRRSSKLAARRSRRPGRSARRPNASATTSPPRTALCRLREDRPARRGSWPTATRWPDSRRAMPTIPRPRLSTPSRWRRQTIRPTGPTRTCSRPARSSSGSRPRSPTIPASCTTSSTPTMSRRSRRRRVACRAPLREDCALGAACAAHAVAHVHPPRLLAGFDRDQHRFGRAPRDATVRRPKSCTRWTIRRTPICRRRRIAAARRLMDALSGNLGALRSEPRRFGRAPVGRRVRARGDSGALRARA